MHAHRETDSVIATFAAIKGGIAAKENAATTTLAIL